MDNPANCIDISINLGEFALNLFMKQKDVTFFNAYAKVFFVKNEDDGSKVFVAKDIVRHLDKKGIEFFRLINEHLDAKE
jgi:hypothetical protein